MEYTVTQVTPVTTQVNVNVPAEEADAALSAAVAMYKLPSLSDVKECVINKAVVEKGLEPLLFYHQEVKSA